MESIERYIYIPALIENILKLQFVKNVVLNKSKEKIYLYVDINNNKYLKSLFNTDVTGSFLNANNILNKNENYGLIEIALSYKALFPRCLCAKTTFDFEDFKNTRIVTNVVKSSVSLSEKDLNKIYKLYNSIVKVTEKISLTSETYRELCPEHNKTLIANDSCKTCPKIDGTLQWWWFR